MNKTSIYQLKEDISIFLFLKIVYFSNKESYAVLYKRTVHVDQDNKKMQSCQ